MEPVSLEKQLTTTDNLSLFRILCLFAGFGVILTGFFYQMLGIDIQTTDSIPLRIGVGVIVLLIALLSYVNKYVRKNIDIFTYGWFFISGTWSVWLLVGNHFASSAVLTVVWQLIIFSIAPVRKMWQIPLFLMFEEILAGIATLVVVSAQTDKVLFLTNISLYCFFLLLFTVIRFQEVESLKLSKDSFALIFNESIDAIFLLSGESLKITDVNDQALRLFGIHVKEELIAFLEPVLIEHIATLSPKRPNEESEIKLPTKKSTELWGNIGIKRTKIGKRDIVIVRISDITDRKKAEEELKIRSKEMERLNTLMIGRELKMAELKKEIEAIRRPQS